MTSSKTRYEVSLDIDLAAQLNARAKKQGASKSDIMLQAVKAFLERGTEEELAPLIAKGFEGLSRNFNDIRHELESARHDRAQMKSDGAKIIENLSLLNNRLNTKLPPPDTIMCPTRRGRFFGFIGRIVRGIVYSEPRHEGWNP